MRDPSGLTAADREEIRALHREWLRREREGREADVVGLCTPDAVWMVPGGPVLRGTAAVRRWLGAGSGQPVALEVDPPEIEGDGSLAVLRAVYRARYLRPGATTPERMQGMHLWVLRRAQGEWRVGVVSWTGESGEE